MGATICGTECQRFEILNDCAILHIHYHYMCICICMFTWMPTQNRTLVRQRIRTYSKHVTKTEKTCAMYHRLAFFSILPHLHWILKINNLSRFPHVDKQGYQPTTFTNPISRSQTALIPISPSNRSRSPLSKNYHIVKIWPILISSNHQNLCPKFL